MPEQPDVIFPIEPWSITEEAFSLDHNYRNETTFALSNGYLGTRGTQDECPDLEIDSGLEGNFSVNDLLTEPFLQKYTSFKNLEAFQTAVGKKLETVEDLTALNGTDVLKQTKFATGEELLHQAVEDYVAAAFAD